MSCVSVIINGYSLDLWFLSYVCQLKVLTKQHIRVLFVSSKLPSARISEITLVHYCPFKSLRLNFDESFISSLKTMHMA